MEKPLYRHQEYAGGYHNVGSVISGSHDDIIDQVERHYALRIGAMPPATREFLAVVPDVQVNNPNVVAHMEYLSVVMGLPITAVALRELTGAQPPVTVIPYINDQETATKFEQAQVKTIGLPPYLVADLKNKADCHDLIERYGDRDLMVGEYLICELHQFSGAADTFREAIERLYALAGCPNYPVGIMVRAELSDGQYGGCRVVQEAPYVVSVTPNGDSQQKTFFDSWKEGLRAAHDHLFKTMNKKKQTRLVVSRYMDLADSPGMSLGFVGGQLLSLGLNGQLQHPGNDACTGTSSYDPRYKKEESYLQKVAAKIERDTPGKIMRFFKKLNRHVYKGSLHWQDLTGTFLNVDLMIPGAQEREFRAQFAKAVKNDKKLRYAVEHYAPSKPLLHRKVDDVLIAEFNPRFTNWSDAIMFFTLMEWVKENQRSGKPNDFTFSLLLRTIAHGVKTDDRYPAPTDDVEKLRAEFLAAHHELQAANAGAVVLRMPPDNGTMGVMFQGRSGDTSHAEQILEKHLAKLR